GLAVGRIEELRGEDAALLLPPVGRAEQLADPAAHLPHIREGESAGTSVGEGLEHLDELVAVGGLGVDPQLVEDVGAIQQYLTGLGPRLRDGLDGAVELAPLPGVLRDVRQVWIL